MNFRLAQPRVIIDVNRIHGLDYILEADRAVEYGLIDQVMTKRA